MTPALDTALDAVRGGRILDAEVARRDLDVVERLRLDLALAHRRGQPDAAARAAAALWHALAVDPTVLAALVAHHHAGLGAPAAALLERMVRDAARDLGPAWEALATDPGALDGWRDVVGALVATGRDLEAIDGVGTALAAGAGGLALWTILVTALIDYRRGDALVLALELGRFALAGTVELHAIATMIHLGLGDLDAALAELAVLGPRSPDHPLVIAAHTAVAAATARAWSALG